MGVAGIKNWLRQSMRVCFLLCRVWGWSRFRANSKSFWKPYLVSPPLSFFIFFFLFSFVLFFYFSILLHVFLSLLSSFLLSSLTIKRYWRESIGHQAIQGPLRRRGRKNWGPLRQNRNDASRNRCVFRLPFRHFRGEYSRNPPLTSWPTVRCELAAVSFLFFLSFPFPSFLLLVYLLEFIQNEPFIYLTVESYLEGLRGVMAHIYPKM